MFKDSLNYDTAKHIFKECLHTFQKFVVPGLLPDSYERKKIDLNI